MPSAAQHHKLTFAELYRPLFPFTLVGIPSALVLAWAARSFAPLSAVEAAFGSAFVVVTVGLMTILLRVLLQWRGRGAVLHDVATATAGRLPMVVSGLMAASTGPFFILWATDLIPPRFWWEPLPVFTMGLFALGVFLASWGRFLVCAEGLWIYHRLVPWNAMGSFRWDSDDVLHLTHAHRPMLGGAILPIPESKRRVVEETLLERGVPRG